mgnify:CR=1 FL=1
MAQHDMILSDTPVLHPANWLRGLRAQVPRKTLRDRWNRICYGPEAPQSDELIFVPPDQIHYTYDSAAGKRPLRRQESGMILGGDWDRCRSDMSRQIKIKSCRMRYVDGAEWPETPLFRKFLKEIAEGRHPDGCRTPEELAQRYEGLDHIYKQTKARGRLLSQAELPDFFRREHGGILVHIGRNGELLRASGGMHRFAIAQILGLPEIPAQLGVVHPEALYKGLLAPLRISRLR